jgi:hypothetical protein
LVRALWRNRPSHRPFVDSPERRQALEQLHQAARGMRSAMSARDSWLVMDRFAADGDAALKLLLIAALRPAAERGRPFLAKELEKARFLKLAKPLKALSLSRAALLDHPTVLLEFPNHDVRTLNRWLVELYGQRRRGRPRKSP